MTEKTPPLEVLRGIRFLAALGDESLRPIQKGMSERHFVEGDAICEEGDEGTCLYLIASGCVAVEKCGEGGTAIEIAELQEGQIAGEMSLFANELRSATLRAKTPVSIWTLEHTVFKERLSKDAALASAVISSLTDSLARGSSLLARLLSHGVDPRFKIAVFDSKTYTEDSFNLANQSSYCLRFFESRLTAETVSLAAGMDAVCVFVNDSVNAQVVRELQGMGIRLIALRCAGFNNVDLKACARYDVSVVRVPAYSPYAVAEHAIALMMSLNRCVHRASNRIREGNFSLKGLVGFDIHGRTAGIVGAGKIGECVMSILAGFGCRLLVHSRTPKPELTEKYGAEWVDLGRLLAESDIISLHAPLTPETHHMIDAPAIARMKRGVMLINTSRGGLVDTAALLEGLKSGQIGYAGLDVYEEESAYFFEDLSDEVMTDDALARLTTFHNVIVTSHQAFLTSDALANIADTTLQNIREYQDGRRGKDLTHAVTV